MVNWTKEEVDFLTQNYNKMTNKNLCDCLDKSLSSINSKSLRLNLKKGY